MMPIIRVLPEELVSKIAAGEVVERPASVVKELVENSIDAGAANIIIEADSGGKRRIRVSDDGCGMSREDAILSIERHATSKLSDLDGLFNIKTMGFRGEALSSIASVSRFTLSTALKGADSGTLVRVEGGRIKETKDAPPAGTSIEADDLFFNTPARKKFLKADRTELSHIIETATRLALSHPEISFTVKTDSPASLMLPKAKDFEERLSQVYGGEFADRLLRIEGGGRGMSFTGFVSKPDALRSARSYQYLFVNRRPVRDPSVTHAVYAGFEGIIDKDSHPAFFIYLDIDPARADFNVHPTKQEVRFERKDEIHSLIRDRVGRVLSSLGPKFSFPNPDAPAGGAFPFAQYISAPSSAFESPANYSGTFTAEQSQMPISGGLRHLYIGESFSAVALPDGGVMLIDHHAAHERVLFEKLLGKKRLVPHLLLFPRQVKLSRNEHSAIIENAGLLETMGIEVEDFGHDTVIVRSVPEEMKDADLRGALADAASAISEGKRPGEAVRKDVAARIACHSSVRGSGAMSAEALASLIKDLEETENPGQCPHGRPTRIFYSINDLRKLFGRL